MKILKNITIYTMVGVFLLSYPIQGFYFENRYKTWYKCYVDICNWTKYCDHISRRCEDCSTRFHDCFTPDQKPNCTIFCVRSPGACLEYSFVISSQKDFKHDQSCPPLKPLLHGHHNGSYGQGHMYGTIVSFTCEGGYQNIGVMETICQDFGRWSHLELNVSQPLCKKNTCMIPHPPAHGRFEFPPNITEFVVGSKIFYSCETGYELRGKDSRRTCVTKGKWTGTSPECAENKCKIPHPPAYGRVEFPPDITEFVVGSKIFYSCETGYELHGKYSNRTCLTNGIWSGTLPECVENFCKLPTIPINGGIIIPSGLEHFVPGTWITYTCNDGFSLKGDAKRQCLPYGVWSLNSATCVAKEPSVSVWKIAAISSWCLHLLSILVFIYFKVYKKYETYEKIPETKDQTEKLKIEEETLETTISQTTIPLADNMTIDTKNVRSLKEQKKAILPSPAPSQVLTNEGNKTVVIENCQNVFLSNGDNNTYLADTAPNNQKESCESVENPVTMNAVKETDQGLKTVIHNDTEMHGNLIAQESTL